MSITRQYHHDAKAAFDRLLPVGTGGRLEDLELVEAFFAATDPRPVVPIGDLAPGSPLVADWPPPCVRKIGRQYYVFMPLNTSPVGPFGTRGEAREFLAAYKAKL